MDRDKQPQQSQARQCSSRLPKIPTADLLATPTSSTAEPQGPGAEFTAQLGRGFWHKRLIAPILGLLQQGLTP